VISIIIRTYNNQDTIARSVNSALSQKGDVDFEVIVVNDGSTDNTEKIVQGFDSRVKLINQRNQGIIEAAYTGLNNSSGEYLTFLDADDELKPDLLDKLLKSLVKSSAAFSYCDYYEVSDEKKKVVSLSNIFNSVACGILFKRSVIDDVGFWDRKFLLPEYDLLIRIMRKYKGVHVPEPLYVYNRHNESYTADKARVSEAKAQLFNKYGEIKGLRDY